MPLVSFGPGWLQLAALLASHTCTADSFGSFKKAKTIRASQRLNNYINHFAFYKNEFFNTGVFNPFFNGIVV